MTEVEITPVVPEDLCAAIATAMRSGEKLLWAGVPYGGINIRRSDLPGMLMGLFLVLGAASLLGTVADIFPGKNAALPADLTTSLIMPLMIVALAVTGLYHLVGRVGWDAYRRKHSLYTVTTENALIWYRGPGSRITEIPLVPLAALAFVERPHDSGTIILGRDRRVSRGWPKYTTIRAPRFELADNALWVYRLVEAVHRRSYWVRD